MFNMLVLNEKIDVKPMLLSLGNKFKQKDDDDDDDDDEVVIVVVACVVAKPCVVDKPLVIQSEISDRIETPSESLKPNKPTRHVL